MRKRPIYSGQAEEYPYETVFVDWQTMNLLTAIKLIPKDETKLI